MWLIQPQCTRFDGMMTNYLLGFGQEDHFHAHCRC
jgi:hypothetical protein